MITVRLALALAIAAACGQPAAACMPPVAPDIAKEVRVNADAETPVDRIAGIAWKAVAVAGRPIPDFVNTTLLVTSEGNVSGTSGCNRFSGPVSIGAGTLAFGPLRTTRMACAPDVMAVERAFHAALDDVAGFALSPEGMLELTRADGSVAMVLAP